MVSHQCRSAKIVAIKTASTTIMNDHMPRNGTLVMRTTNRRVMAKKTQTQSWNTTDIPDQTGRTAVVTGANSGLGLATATALAAAGAHVVLAVRDIERGKAAAATVRKFELTLLPAAGKAPSGERLHPCISPDGIELLKMVGLEK